MMKRLFVSARGGLGDLILRSPVFRALRLFYPRTGITLLTDPQCRDFAMRYGWVNEVLVYQRGLKATLGLFQTLRKQDAVIMLDRGQRCARLAWLARVPVRAGAHIRRSRNLTHEADMSDWNENAHYQPETVAEIIHRSLGLDLHSITDMRALEMPAFSPEEIQRTDHLIQAHVRDPERILLVAPFTVVHHREWPLASYQELIFRLERELGICPVVIGSIAERDVLLARSLEHCVNLAGKTSFMEMGVLISRARLLVGSCSGHAHVAAALHRPAVILYGPSYPSRFANPNSIIPVSLGLACMGCVDRSGNSAVCADRRCLTQLSVDTVFNACRHQWSLHVR